MVSPDIWGQYLWSSIHYIALGYPVNPTETEKKNYKEFLLNLWKVIPCQSCAIHYKENIKEQPILDEDLENTETLFKWTVDIHNKVNKQLGKKKMTVEDARKMYLNKQPEKKFSQGSVIIIAICVLLVTFVLIKFIFWVEKLINPPEI